jgi:hypothetical protein
MQSVKHYSQLGEGNWFYGFHLSTGQKMSRNLLYDIKRSEQMAFL